MCLKAVFYPQVIDSLAVFMQDPKVPATSSINFNEFQYEPNVQFNRNCGKIIYKVYNANNPAETPPFISVQGTDIAITWSKMNPGRFDGILWAYLEDYPDKEIRTPFSVAMVSSKITCLPSGKKDYLMGDPPLQFGVSYANITEGEGVKLTATVTPVSVLGGSPTGLPGFVSYNAGSKQFTVEGITS